VVTIKPLAPGAWKMAPSKSSLPRPLTTTSSGCPAFLPGPNGEYQLMLLRLQVFSAAGRLAEIQKTADLVANWSRA